MRLGWNAVSYQILNPGIAWWFDPAGDAVVGYATHARTRVVAGAPVCAESRLDAVVAAFAADARSHGEHVVYFGAGERLERRYRDNPRLALVPLGAQPWWDPAEWDAKVRAHRSLREQRRRARAKGVRIEEWPAARAHRHPALERVLARWLATRGLPPLHFLVEPETLGHLADRRVFVARRGEDDDGILAFLVATPIPGRAAWLFEQWPRVREAPNGTVDSLVDAAMRALAADGARAVTMGLSPLSPHGPPLVTSPRWLGLVLRWVRAHGRRFYDFDGLDRFKSKFHPDAWEPIHAMDDGPRFSMRSLRAIAGVFSAGSPFVLVARAITMAAREELRRLRKARRER
jgi:phosphatidylglycerol lysyltransferase